MREGSQSSIASTPTVVEWVEPVARLQVRNSQQIIDCQNKICIIVYLRESSLIFTHKLMSLMHHMNSTLLVSFIISGILFNCFAYIYYVLRNYDTGVVPDVSKCKSQAPAAARATKGGNKKRNKAHATPPTSSGNCPTVDNMKRRMEQWRRIEEEAMRQQEEQERQQKEQEWQAELEQQQEEQEQQQGEEEQQEQPECQKEEQECQQKEHEQQQEQEASEIQDLDSSKVRRLFVNGIVDIHHSKHNLYCCWVFDH